jgi:O-antigen ligase
MEWENRLNIFDILILVFLVAMVVLAPLAMGSVTPWARNAIVIGSLCVTALWIMQMAGKGRLLLLRDPLLLVPIILFVGILLLQLLPLAPDTLNAISPATAEIYENTLPDYPASGEARTISITPYNTEWEIRRLAAFLLVFLVIAHTFRTRRQVMTLLIALIVIGSFEAVYGLAERFSGGNHIFWNERIFMKEAVSGTFINKNHFAGFLEMIIPVALGLFVSMRHKGVRGGTFRAKTLEAMRAPNLNRQVILGLLIVLMVVSVLFSLSRAGITCAIGSWVAFSLFIGLTAGIRGYTLTLLFLLLLILCISVSMGSDMVIERMEDAASSEAISWTGRFDLWGGGLRMIEDFPLLGSGFGTFEEGYERYQSSRFGDKYADYLHNDLLQIFCETGIIGGLVALGGLALLLISLARKTLRRHDTFCRWVATGLMLGCCAILLHSLFDFNLYKITSNGLVFSVLLALWYATVHMSGTSRKSHRRLPAATIPLKNGISRYAVVALPLLLVFPAIYPIQAARADIHLNHYLASSATPLNADYYFFLPTGNDGEGDAADHLAKAAALDGESPYILYRRGVDRINAAGALVREKTRAEAVTILEEISAGDDSAALEELTLSLFPSFLIDMAGERRPYMQEASELVREAARRKPAEKRYYLTLAEIACELEREKDSGPKPSEPDATGRAKYPGEQDARTALWLCPNKPGILFRAGKILLVNAFRSGCRPKDTELLTFIEDCFRRSIASDPRYTDQIYPLVRSHLHKNDSLFSITPFTIVSYSRLSDYFLLSSDWEAALRSLDKLTELCCLTGDGDAVKAMSPSEAVTYIEGSTGFDRRDPLSVKISASQRRTQVLGILRRFEERGLEELRCRSLLREKGENDLLEARALKGEFRFRESYATVRKILERDWANPKVLLLAAELALIPGEAVATGWNSPIDHLFRLVIYNSSLDRETADRAGEILGKIRPGNDRERLIAEFLGGALNVISGRFATGVEALAKLGQSERLAAAGWRSDHLIDYYRGLGLEGANRNGQARDAYLKVLKKVPTHLDSVERLAVLGTAIPPLPPGSVPTPALKPDVRVDVCFGGKVILTGFTLEREGDGNGEKKWFITYYWKFIERMPEGYHPKVHFKGRGRKLIFHDEHDIVLTGEGTRPYPVTSPRCGETVIERRELGSDPILAEFLSVEFISKGRDPLVTGGGNQVFWTTVPERDDS